MIILKKELGQGKWSLLVWTLLLSSMLGLCILVYPQMKSQMEEIADSFSHMGDFSAALGMEQMNFGKFQDYFGLECNNIMGLLGCLFAALLGIRSLSCEEGGHTAEFLLTHPVTRSQVVTEKLLSLIVQVTILNFTVTILSLGMIAAIGEEIQMKRILLLFFSNYLMHLEICCITFGISSFLHRNNFALGIGIGAAAYFLNILSNLMDDLKFLKYITPMGYTDSSSILYEGSIDIGYLISGMAILFFSVVTAFWKYCRKEII